MIVVSEHAEIIGKGLQEANNILFFNKPANKKSILRAIDSLDKEEFHHPRNRERCRLKLQKALKALGQDPTPEPVTPEPVIETTYVKPKEKAIVQKSLVVVF